MTEESRAFAVTHRGVLAIALPMTLAYLTTPLVGVVSLGVVGQLGDPALVGGVAIGALIFDVAFATFNFLRSGTTGLAAQALGAGKREEIVAIFWRALFLALAIGAILLALQAPFLGLALNLIGGSGAVQAATRTYWQIRVLAAPLALANYVILGWLIGLGRAGYGLLLQLVLNGVNIAVSVALVDQLHFGVAGVGWASVAAESVAALIGLVVVVRLCRNDPRPSFARIVDGQAFRRMIAVNRDIMIRSFALLFAFAFFTARSADAGDVVLAANEILINLTIVAAYFLDGLAAAAEQLQTWGDRVGAETVRSEKDGADPASVAFEAVSKGIESEVDVVLIDTAGRLHTKTGLMDELGKVKRVIEKKASVDEVLLVLDATTGQNGLRQARVFAEVVDVTGIVLTKLDGTAKGGIVIAVQQELGVPVKLVGLGEGPDDLAPFDPDTFVDAIIG